MGRVAVTTFDGTLNGYSRQGLRLLATMMILPPQDGAFLSRLDCLHTEELLCVHPRLRAIDEMGAARCNISRGYLPGGIPAAGPGDQKLCRVQMPAELQNSGLTSGPSNSSSRTLMANHRTLLSYALIAILLLAPGTFARAADTPKAPAAGATRINPKDGAEMVYVPAGKFLMGSTEAEINDALTAFAHFPGVKKEWVTDQGPQRSVYLDGCWIYKNDVTVAQYRKFCQATGKKMPMAPGWGWQEDHPVVTVTWHDAKAYCDWAGAALPSEAQWEKAARGTDGRTYPWWGGWDFRKLWCSVGVKRQSTAPVGSLPAGASPYGCLDMLGNVCQWCADWYDENYYRSGNDHNPQGPATGTLRVLRGGSWRNDNAAFFRAALRFTGDPTTSFDYIGFRAVCTSPN